MELYVHFPFCRQKCNYCDFVSFPGMEGEMEHYLNTVVHEAELTAGDITEPVTTVYFGGGTPSLIPENLMRDFLRSLRETLPLDGVSEWTTEANPGTLTRSWLDMAREGGINRLSLGMQAAQPDLLKMLGRIHSMEEVEKSVKEARSAGFDNVNLDLIFGLPGQTPEDWKETIYSAFDLAPEHISAYGLIPEEGTPLWNCLQSGLLQLPDSDAERDMYDCFLRESQKHGYVQYEISNFARPGYACLHNIGYWNQTPYLGLGVSAASLIHMTPEDGGVTYLRRTESLSMKEYFAGIQDENPRWSEYTRISPAEARFETMMLGLRMNRGVREDEFYRLHGRTVETCYGEKLAVLEKDGLINHQNGSWYLTRMGMDLQNYVLTELMD